MMAFKTGATSKVSTCEAFFLCFSDLMGVHSCPRSFSQFLNLWVFEELSSSSTSRGLEIFFAMAGSLSSMAAEVLAQIQQVFTARQQLGHGGDPAIDLVEVVLKAKEQQIVLHGVGREGLMMRALAMRLYHLGLKAHCLGDMSCPPVGSGDLLLASAGPGSFSSVDALIATAKKAGATVAVITAQPEGNAPSLADLTIWLLAQTMADVEAAGDTTGERTPQAKQQRRG